MKKLLIVFMTALLLVLPSCDPDAGKPAELTQTEKDILKKVVVADFGTNSAIRANETIIGDIKGINEISGDDTLVDGVLSMTYKSTSSVMKVQGKLNNENLTLETNYSYVAEGKDSSTDINDYKDESYIKFNNTTWAKSSDEFKKFIGNNVQSSDGDLYKAHKLFSMVAAPKSFTSYTGTETFDLLNADSSYSGLNISDVKITTTGVKIVRDQKTPASDTSNREPEVQTITFGQVAINYKDAENNAKELKLDSSVLECKVQNDSDIVGVKKDAKIKVGGKSVILTDLFDSSILY